MENTAKVPSAGTRRDLDDRAGSPISGFLLSGPSIFCYINSGVMVSRCFSGRISLLKNV